MDAGDHEKAFMHVGDTDDMNSSEDEEAQGGLLRNRKLKITNDQRSLEIRLNNNGVGTEMERVFDRYNSIGF